jgi:hypothetical protein
MIIKKLAVPLINDKILLQAEHCYIGTAAISEPAFDLIRTRLSPRCKIEILTGLDGPVSPSVLRKIWRHYHDRIALKIYTKNTFHANVYIFDLPYRKAVAFLGSGHLTFEGIKDSEELFYKITDPKEIEALKSWFTGYYEFSEPLTENIVQEYELIYPSIMQREIASREEKDQVIGLTTRGFDWETIKFKNQFFKKEDYLTFGNNKAFLDTPDLRAERTSVQNKFSDLHELIKKHLDDLGLVANQDINKRISSLNPSDHPDQKLRTMRICYGKSEAELNRYHGGVKADDLMTLQIIVRQREFGIWLMVGKSKGGKEDRDFFRTQMEAVEYRATFFKLVQGLGVGYWIEIAGEKKPVTFFQTEDALWEFTKPDDWQYYTFVIGKNYTPGDPEISNEKIAVTVMKESDKLILLYKHLKVKI